MRVYEPYTLFVRHLPSGKDVYYYQYRRSDGTRSNAKSTGCTSLAAAKRFCNKLYISGEFEKSSSTRFEIYSKDFFEKDKPYYKWRKVSKRCVTDNSLNRYKQCLEYQLMPYFKGKQIAQISRQEIKNWIIWASDTWSESTVNNAQTVLNLILDQAVEEEIIKANPANNLSFRRRDKVQRQLLTLEEVIQIYHSDKWTSEEVRKAYLVAVTTGMRIGEVVALKSDDIDEDVIRVTRNWVKQTHSFNDVKTHEKRFVPKPKELTFDTVGLLFPGNDEEPMNISRVRDNLFTITNSLGIDYFGRNLNTHTLRNFFISYLQRMNVSEAKIKAVVGHKDSSMTGLYTYWTSDMFSEVYVAQKALFDAITA